MMANSYKVIANSTLPCPFFALSSSISSIEEDGTIIGGCVYDMNLYCEEIVKMINAVADGKQARDIPYYDPKPMVLFNYPYMVVLIVLLKLPSGNHLLECSSYFL